MAVIRATVPQRETWEPGDRLRLLLGAENALDMDGAQQVSSIEAYALDGEPRTLEREYLPEDVAALMPIAVDAVDELGNISDHFESLVQLDDAPRGVREVGLEGTGTVGEARLTWTVSPHV